MKEKNKPIVHTERHALLVVRLLNRKDCNNFKENVIDKWGKKIVYGDTYDLNFVEK